ncbi:hypothetical protein D3C78_1323210 [compost metagenome]
MRVIDRQLTAVDPGQISGFDGLQQQSGHGINTLGHQITVGAQINQQRVQPVLAMLVGGLGGNQRQYVHLWHDAAASTGQLLT